MPTIVHNGLEVALNTTKNYYKGGPHPSGQVGDNVYKGRSDYVGGALF